MVVIPPVIQGGMGVAVSGWRLARAVARLGGLGVVSGTALAHVLSRRLQSGDPDGHMRRGLALFPDAAMVERALEAHYVPGGKPPEAPFRTLPLPSHRPPPALVELIVLAAFVEVSLAKQGHTNPVGINLLEKIQLPTLPSLYGAMLAGVDVVIMGAGIPRQIPGALDAFARGEAAELALSVEGTLPGETFPLRFDPAAFWGAAFWGAAFRGTTPPRLERPAFLAIVSSEPLARALARKANGRVDGFIIEAPSAGGHNAPPRGPLTLTSTGEPLYGERDKVDLAGMQALGLPFWLAGSCGREGLLRSAQARGAAGIQVGTAFAFCEESGIDPDAQARGPRAQPRRRGARVHGSPGVSHRLPVQGRAGAGLALGGRGGRRSASASATWATCDSPSDATTAAWATAAPPSPRRTTCARVASRRPPTADSASATA